MASKHAIPPPPADERSSSKRGRLESKSETSPFRVQLNPADCSLEFDVVGNGLKGRALHEGGFAYCWSGARATVGITGGKYCFGCKIVSEQAVDMRDTPLDQQHLCHVGTSRGDNHVSYLGESLQSFGYGGTGKFSSAGKFSDYGSRFGVGDTIVCAVDLEAKPLATIGFSVNGTWLGVARQFNASSMSIGIVSMSEQDLTWKSALYPHILLKNVVVQLKFSIEDGLIPEKGYKPWNLALGDGNSTKGPSFVSPNESEVMMMVGLPASGKSTWAEKWVKEHPEKRYIILGTNLVLDQMKVPGLNCKNNYGERFDCLMDHGEKIFNTLLDRAAKTMRNYILDQTNVYRDARIRKLMEFRNHHKIAIVIFPPSSELKIRAEKRAKKMGNEVPAEVMNEMIANFVLPITKNTPGSKELFDEVWFEELYRAEAQTHLEGMKRAPGSSNINANRDLSFHFGGNYARSFPRQSPSAAGSHQPKVLDQSPDYLNTQEVTGSFSVPQTRLENASIAFPYNGPYENLHKSGTDAIQRSEVDPYGTWTNHNKIVYASTLQLPIMVLPQYYYMVHQTRISTDAQRPPDMLHYQSYTGVNLRDEPNLGYPPLHHPPPYSQHGPDEDTCSSSAPSPTTQYIDSHQTDPGPHHPHT